MFTNTIHGGAAPSMTTSVYYTGSDTLCEGYTLCYDFNAADVNQENVAQTSPDVGEDCWADARRVLVEKCTESNKIHFAGVVAAQSDGVTGPGWVTIHVPGSICNVYANSDCDHEDGAPRASGQVLNVCVGQYYMKTGGWCGSGSAMVLQDIDRSTAGLVMAELQVGPPSGGVCDVTSDVLSAAGTNRLSCVLSAIPIYCGVYQEVDAAAGITSVNTMSTYCLAADGNWAGQKVAFIGHEDTYSQTVWDIAFSQVSRGFWSSDTTPVVTSCTIDISTTGDYVVMEFDGVNWELIGSHESVDTA